MLQSLHVKNLALIEEAEVESAVASGARPITLGHRILRTETAGLAILSVLMFRLEQDSSAADGGN